MEKNKVPLKNKRGFTLIEVLIYSLLLSFVLIGALGIAYNIIESSDKNSARVAVEQEGSFLLRKIDWALTGATVINEPVVNSSGPILNIDKLGADNPLEFTLSDGKIWFSQGEEAPVELNSDSVKISNLNFIYNDTGEITASFMVDSVIAGSKDFETTKYLRK